MDCQHSAETFEIVVEQVKTKLSEDIGQAELLKLYGLYKQALYGDIPTPKPRNVIDIGVLFDS